MMTLGSRSHVGVAETKDVIRLAVSANRAVADLEGRNDLGVVRFEDPRARWNIAFCNASVPDGMRAAQYHRQGRMPDPG